MSYYPRVIEPVLLKAAGQFRILALTGSRQTGKSTLLKRLFHKTHRYVTLDDPGTLKLAQSDPRFFFEEFKQPLILDEIQYAPQLLSYIKMLVDASPRKGQFLLTGSQQFTMIKGLKETLAGRVGLFQLFPMSVEEGPKTFRSYEARGFRGSYPEILTTRSAESKNWFSSYVATYLEKDVQMHYRLEKITYFKDLLFLLASRVSQALNYQSLASDLGVSLHAVKLWIRILETSQIIYLLRPYYVNLGSRLVKAPKVYFTDVGLANFLTGNQDKANLTRGSLAGAFFENFIVQETLKFFSARGETAPIYYYRTNNGLEVDLIIEKEAGAIVPCEIKLTRTPDRRMVRASERLREFKNKNMKIKEGFLVCRTDESHALSPMDKAVNLTAFLRSLETPARASA